jgi:predicted O-methyltransferase YrrM
MQSSRARRLAGKIKRKLSYGINLAFERWRDHGWHSSTPNPVLARALGPLATTPSDIRDHIGTIFYEAISSRPRLLVELGTRGGVSTRTLLAAAEIANAHVLSIDIEDCSAIDLPAGLRERWTFIHADDVVFAGEPFATFCAARALPPVADVILVDTSHLYEHTCAEIRNWLPRLGQGGVIMFHDTNMGMDWYRQLDRHIGPGWENERGVIRAVEEFFGRRYDEQTFFTDVAAGFVITHLPWSAGFLVMRKIGDGADSYDLGGSSRATYAPGQDRLAELSFRVKS